MSTTSQDYLDDLIAVLRKYGDTPLRDSYMVEHIKLYGRKDRMTDAELGAEVRLLLTALKVATGGEDVPRGV